MNLHRTGQSPWRLAPVIGVWLTISIAGCAPPPPVPPAAVPVTAPGASRKFNFTPAQAKVQAENPPVTIAFPRFTDVAESVGIRHIYQNGASPKALMVESTGGGCGWLDYDRDGLIDLFLTQGGVPDATSLSANPPDALYRQSGDGRFVDVAALAGVDDRGYGQGVAAGDVDNDGFDDLFIANVGRCSFYLNQGDGTFRPADDWLVGKRNVWSSTVAWGDIDRDGDLDLYVCNYAKYDPHHPVPCRDRNGAPTICHPREVEPEADEFFLNSGDGRLVESSRALGLFGPGNKALGVVIADLPGDDWPDIFVANDTQANFLFVNEEGRHFKESAMILGGAFSATGESQANMGIAFGDFDGNGWMDLCITHFTGEGHTLYQNLGSQGLQDVTARTGLRQATLSKLGFGTVMSDFNLDGHMDLFFTNGHIDPKFADSEGYEMTPQLFSFDGSRWHDGSPAAGEFFQLKSVGRGVATADFDRDGDLDLCVVHQNTPTALLRNDSPLGHGLRVEVIGTVSNRNGYGARVHVHCGGKRMYNEVAGGTSYAATHERTLFFGLGDTTGPCRIEVRWPSGMTDTVELAGTDRLVTIREGQTDRSAPHEPN
ncbi:MAG: CRTAC1 family protein [Planctomycetia bacterium]|nr:CRTAC1 family protein [Planctomycetia bacterium]